MPIVRSVPGYTPVGRVNGFGEIGPDRIITVVFKGGDVVAMELEHSNDLSKKYDHLVVRPGLP